MTATQRFTPLSEDGTFERIVNEKTAQQRAIRRRWFNNTTRAIVVMLSLFLLNLILWVCGAIPSVSSVCVTVTLTCVISFLAGRIYEKFCK